MREVIFDWSVAAVEASRPLDKLPWAAFYGDCVHEVLPVTEGLRVTITFGIMASEGGDDDMAPAPDAAASAAASGAAPPAVGAAAILARALAIIAARPEAASSFGILLSHKYTLGATAVGQLKGSDATLFSALADSGLYLLTLQPAAYHYHRYGGYPGSGDDGGGYTSHTVHAFGAPELVAIRLGCSDGFAGSSEAAAATPRIHIPFVRFSSPDAFVLPDATPGTLLKHASIESAEHTGNEARAGEDDYIYFSVALLIAPLAAAAQIM
jgi:hypothetical protein